MPVKFDGRSLKDAVAYCTVLSFDAKRVAAAMQHHHREFLGNAEVQAVLNRFAMVLQDAALTLDHAAAAVTPKVKALIEAS
jgi:hypothetical protein